MLMKLNCGLVVFVFLVAFVVAQPPRRDPLGWFERADADRDGRLTSIEVTEFAQTFFKQLDANGDGVIDRGERPRGPRQPQGPPPAQLPGGRRGPRGPFGPGAPFVVMESLRGPAPISVEKFLANVAVEFGLLDRNRDGFITVDEVAARLTEIERDPRPEGEGRGMRPPKDSPTARFVGAELRFGDRLIKGAPFSAEIVIEDTRRLFDGSTVTNRLKGLVARDSEGRTRREQPLPPIGGFNVVGSDGNPQKLIFINDFATQTQYFLDVVRQVAVRETIRNQRPDNEPALPRNAKTESLGTRLMEGVSVEGTRTSFEIPVGEIGNDKPLTVVTEKWFSPTLGVLVMSRHSDPIAGEHVFKLVNLKLAEPSPALFTVPPGYKIQTPNREGRKE